MIYTMTTEKTKIGKWIWKKYLDWLAEGGYRSQAEFARSLQIDNTVLNHYINGRRLPTGDNIEKLAKLGPEIYDLLGLVRPDPKIQALLNAIYSASPEQLDAILNFVFYQLGMERDKSP
jgi:transcriptional regulator with XRE-family HTH domain